jgi:hypothetical protein
MNLKPLHFINFNDNDIYRLEIYGDKIITNEDYCGIRIFDMSLNTVKIIPLIQDFKVYDIYKQFEGNNIIAHDSDKNLFAFIDLKTYQSTIIDISDFIKHYFYSYSYYWQGDNLIFISVNSYNFYKFNFASSILEKISTKEAKSIAPSFFDFYTMCKKYNPECSSIDSEKRTFIFKKNRKLVGFYDHENKMLSLHKHRLGFFQEPYYHKGKFINFHIFEKAIVLPSQQGFIQSSDKEDGYYCLRMKFLENDNLILLESNHNDYRFCRIGIYELQGLSI